MEEDTPQTGQDQQVQPSEPAGPDDITGLDPNRLLAAISYLAFFVFFPLFTGMKDPFVAYHARQGLVVFVGYILGIVAAIWVPVIGNIFILLMIVVSVVGVIEAVQGRRWKIPVITSIASKFSF